MGLDYDDYTRLVHVDARVKRLEAMMEALLARLEIDVRTIVPPEELETDPIRRAVLEGNKIVAIKLYREKYRAGLKESKDAIDALARELGR